MKAFSPICMGSLKGAHCRSDSLVSRLFIKPHDRHYKPLRQFRATSGMAGANCPPREQAGDPAEARSALLGQRSGMESESIKLPIPGAHPDQI
jgi:hypothetical protein